MDSIGIYEAKSRLSELIEKAEAGEVVTITRRGKPVARIVPVKRSEVVDNSEAVDELIRFSKTIKPDKRFNIRKAIESGRR